MSDSAPARVPDHVLDDLGRRLRATRRPTLPRGLGWEHGTDEAYLAELVEYWATAYDWRPHEERIRALPWERAGQLNVVHQRADDAAAPAVVLLHGWPDHVLRFQRVLPPLDEFHVIVPALPGYPFADPLTDPGMSATRMADLVAEALAALGYDRVVVSGGDIGAMVGEALGARHAERLVALHLTDIPFVHLANLGDAELSPAERELLEHGAAWQRWESGYSHEQSTKPHTLAAALADSPAGLAAWIVEKLRTWSDCDGDVERAFPREDLLTWVTAYWVTNTIGTSFSPYVERSEPVERVEVPTVVTIFPHDPIRAPREFAERFFDVRVWQEPPEGGHFGAWERPEAFVAGVRAAVGFTR